MEREVTQRQAKLEAQGWFEHQEALTVAYQGRLKEAARLSDSAVSLSRQAGLRERAAQFEGARAAWNALFGIRDGGERERRCGAVAVPKQGRRLWTCLCAGASARLRASSARSRRISKSATRRTHLSSSVTCLRCGRSKLCNQGDPAKALEMTQVAAPYDLAVPGTAFYSGALLRSSLSGLRAWPRLFPNGPPSRGSG